MPCWQPQCRQGAAKTGRTLLTKLKPSCRSTGHQKSCIVNLNLCNAVTCKPRGDGVTGVPQHLPPQRSDLRGAPGASLPPRFALAGRARLPPQPRHLLTNPNPTLLVQRAFDAWHTSVGPPWHCKPTITSTDAPCQNPRVWRVCACCACVGGAHLQEVLLHELVEPPEVLAAFVAVLGRPRSADF